MSCMFCALEIELISISEGLGHIFRPWPTNEGVELVDSRREVANTCSSGLDWQCV